VATVGLDEVGRGCWAGPLVAAAVILPPNSFWEDCPPKGGKTVLRDSKKLSRKQRECLAQQIKSRAKGYGVGWVTPGEIDDMGLTKAVQLAMLRAMKQIACGYEEIVIDGNTNFFKNVVGLKTDNIKTIIKADDTVPAVSAASILAKVARDDYMAKVALEYPGYGFEKHVGYGTAAHSAALKQLGVTDIHRTSFAPIRAQLHTTAEAEK
jgi:ribonuclease HII